MTVDYNASPAIAESQVEDVYKAVRNLVQASSGLALYDFQREIVRRILDAILRRTGNEIVIEVSRQAGKSTSVAALAFGCTLLLPELFPDRWGRGFRVGVYAPTLDQSKIIFNELKKLFDREILRLAGVGVDASNGNTFSLTNGSVARSLTAGPDAKKEGYTWDLLIIDEAQDVESDVLKKSLFPMVTATGGPRILIGTPTDKPRYFFESLSKLKGSPDAFIFDVDRVVEDRRKMYRVTDNVAHLSYEKSFQRELRRRGRDDAIRSQYYLEWILGTGMFCTSDQLLWCALPYKRRHEFEYPVYAGWDIAKEHDRSVLTIETLHAPKDLWIKDAGNSPTYEVKFGEKLWNEDVERYHSFILDWVQWEGDDYPAQVADVVTILSHYPKLEQLTIDETGVGAGPRDMLKLTPLASRVNTFNFGSGGQKVSDLWTDLQLVGPNKHIRHFPMGQWWERKRGFSVEMDLETGHYVEEMLGATKVYRGQLLKVEAPEGDRYHDDYCASSALSNWGIRNSAGVKLSFINDPNVPAGSAPQRLTVDSLFADSQRSIESVTAPEYEGKQRKPIFFQGTP